MSGRESGRLVRLKCLYWYTILGAGAAGLWLLFSPGSFAEMLGMPRLVREAPPPYTWLFVAVFTSYVVLDLAAIPFGSLWQARCGIQ